MIKRRMKVSQPEVADTLDRTWSWFYGYLLIGGILSALHFIGVLLHTELVPFLISPKGVTNFTYSFSLMLHVIGHSILRVLAWAPDYVRAVILGAQSTSDWLWGLYTLKTA